MAEEVLATAPEPEGYTHDEMDPCGVSVFENFMTREHPKYKAVHRRWAHEGAPNQARCGVGPGA